MRLSRRSQLLAWASQLTREQRRAAAVAGAAHALHDGYTDLIYILLPLWQVEFGLGYAALGVLRGVLLAPWPACKFPPPSYRSGLGRHLCSALALRSLASLTALPE